MRARTEPACSAPWRFCLARHSRWNTLAAGASSRRLRKAACSRHSCVMLDSVGAKTAMQVVGEFTVAEGLGASVSDGSSSTSSSSNSAGTAGAALTISE